MKLIYPLMFFLGVLVIVVCDINGVSAFITAVLFCLLAAVLDRAVGGWNYGT